LFVIDEEQVNTCEVLSVCSYITMMVLLQVIPLGFVFEDDTLVEASDSLVEPHLRHPPCNSILDVDRLLNSVCTYLLFLLHCSKCSGKKEYLCVFHSIIV
jgi:hypothetical protein